MTKEKFELWIFGKESEFQPCCSLTELPEGVPALLINEDVFVILEDGVMVFGGGINCGSAKINLAHRLDDAFAWSKFLMLRDTLSEFIAKFDEVNLRRVRGW